MPTHTVRAGETPATIAIERVGCPKCAIDLVRANPHKEAVVYPNGFKTFRDLREGERLNIPEKWGNGDLESRPPMYFAALPYPDGVTPSTLGDRAAGILGDYATLDAAASMLGALAAMGDQQFNAAVDATAAQIDASVQEALRSSNQAAVGYAQKVLAGTHWAVMRNEDLTEAIASGEQTGLTIRSDIVNSFASALADARLALATVYGSGSAAPTPAPAPAPGGIPGAVVAAAQAAANAIAGDANYCASVARTGTAVNSAVHAFKTAWNASGQAPVPINTGNYEQPAANALAQAIGSAPAACPPRVAAPPSQPRPSPAPAPTPVPTKRQELSVGAVAGLALLGASAVGGVVYLATSRRRRRGGRR